MGALICAVLVKSIVQAISLKIRLWIHVAARGHRAAGTATAHGKCRAIIYRKMEVYAKGIARIAHIADGFASYDMLAGRYI